MAGDYQQTLFNVIDAICRRTPTRRSHYAWNVIRVNIAKFVEPLEIDRAVLESA